METTEKYADFPAIADYFYNILIDNINHFDGLIKDTNIHRIENSQSEPNICVRTN